MLHNNGCCKEYQGILKEVQTQFEDACTYKKLSHFWDEHSEQFWEALAHITPKEALDALVYAGDLGHPENFVLELVGAVLAAAEKRAAPA